MEEVIFHNYLAGYVLNKMPVKRLLLLRMTNPDLKELIEEWVQQSKQSFRLEDLESLSTRGDWGEN